MRKNTDDLLVENYNELFEALDDHCASKWRVNLFSHIGFYELVNLNYLLIQFTRFYKAAGHGKFNDIEYGEYLCDLYHLLDKLVERDLFG